MSVHAVQAFGDIFWRMLCDEFVARVAVPHVRLHAEDAEAASALIESAQVCGNVWYTSIAMHCYRLLQ